MSALLHLNLLTPAYFSQLYQRWLIIGILGHALEKSLQPSSAVTTATFENRRQAKKDKKARNHCHKSCWHLTWFSGCCATCTIPTMHQVAWHPLYPFDNRAKGAEAKAEGAKCWCWSGKKVVNFSSRMQNSLQQLQRCWITHKPGCCQRRRAHNRGELPVSRFCWAGRPLPQRHNGTLDEPGQRCPTTHTWSLRRLWREILIQSAAGWPDSRQPQPQHLLTITLTPGSRFVKARSQSAVVATRRYARGLLGWTRFSNKESLEQTWKCWGKYCCGFLGGGGIKDFCNTLKGYEGDWRSGSLTFSAHSL